MLLVKDDTPLIIISTFSLWVKKQYCDGTKIDEISCENTGGQDSGSIFSDYLRLHSIDFLFSVYWIISPVQLRFHEKFGQSTHNWTLQRWVLSYTSL